MSDSFTQEQIDEFKKAFNMFDIDGDGSITAKELRTIFRSQGLNPTAEEVVEMVESVDKNNNGEIEFDEFLILMS